MRRRAGYPLVATINFAHALREERPAKRVDRASLVVLALCLTHRKAGRGPVPARLLAQGAPHEIGPKGMNGIMNIFVSNLSFDITSAQLQAEFESFGTVSKISIVGNRETGGDSSIAFVEMKNDTEARIAIESLNRKEIAGWQLTVIDLRHKSNSRKERR